MVKGWFSDEKCFLGCFFYVLRRRSTNDKSESEERETHSTRDWQIKIQSRVLSRRETEPKFSSDWVELEKAPRARHGSSNGATRVRGVKLADMCVSPCATAIIKSTHYNGIKFDRKTSHPEGTNRKCFHSNPCKITAVDCLWMFA